jgi:hypothetical protein
MNGFRTLQITLMNPVVWTINRAFKFFLYLNIKTIMHMDNSTYASQRMGVKKKAIFSMSRICDEKCSKAKIFLAFLPKLLCFNFILWYTKEKMMSEVQ